jgi:hypothetical protein
MDGGGAGVCGSLFFGALSGRGQWSGVSDWLWLTELRAVVEVGPLRDLCIQFFTTNAEARVHLRFFDQLTDSLHALKDDRLIFRA